jgi:hypothetical protein
LPLLKRARIEIYLPELGRSDYERLRNAFEQEFLHTFGGCTIIKNIKGLYKGAGGDTHTDRISLVYADTPFDPDKHFKEVTEYTDALREAALEASEEESILIAVHELYHSV